MSEIITTIGNYTISEKDIDAFISSLPKQQQAYKAIPEFRAQVKERLEEMSLFAMLGEETKLEESEEYKEAMHSAKREILGQLAVKSIIEKLEATDEEAKAFYDANVDLFATGPEVTAKHILVDDEAKANDIKAEIESGAKTFEDAAKEYSSCPSKERGGSLGSFGKGQMVKDFETAAFEGEVKTIIGPVKTQFGYHLIWVDEKTDGETPDFEVIKKEVKVQVLQEKQQKAYDENLEELKKKYMK